MKWVKHDTDANQDAKLQNVLLDYGLEGYGLYWYCIELIAGKVDKDNITFELEHDARIIARSVGSTAQKVEEMMRYFVNLGLFEDSSGTVTCLKLARRLDKSMTSNPEMRSIIESLKSHDSVMTKSDKVMQDKIRSDQTREDNKQCDIEDAFKVFYNAGMRKLNPKGALKSFTALCKKLKKQQTPMDIANHLVNDIKIRLANNQMGFDKMHPTTYLNGERWNDERLQESNEKANSQGRNADPMAAVNAAIARREQQRNNQRDEQAGLALENGGRTLPHEMD